MYFYMDENEDENNRQFLRAIREEDIRMVEEGIRCGASEPVNEELYFALDEFLENCENNEIVDMVNKDRALHMSLIDAVVEKDLNKVKLALINGAEINHINWENKDGIPRAAIEYAVNYHNGIDIDIVKAILNTNQKAKHISNTLIDAVFYGEIELLQLLLDKGADVNYMTYEGSVLFHATREKDAKIVRFLLENGAEIGLVGTSSTTTPYEASLYLDDDMEIHSIFEEFMKKNITEDDNEKIVLDCNDEKEGQKEIDEYWQSGFEDAINDGDIEIVTYILSKNKKVDVNQISKYELSPIFLAIERENIEILKLLLEKHVKIDTKNKEGMSALDVAYENNNTEIIELLLKYGAIEQSI